MSVLVDRPNNQPGPDRPQSAPKPREVNAGAIAHKMSSPPNVEGPSPSGPAIPDGNAGNDTASAASAVSAALAVTSSDDVVAVATVAPRTAAVPKPFETAKTPSPLLMPIERELLVMNRHVGRIIGRGGVTIRDIQLRSGAYLDVPQYGQAGETHRKIRISGSAEQVEYCMVLVKLQLPSTDQAEIVQLQAELAELQLKDEKSLLIENVEAPMQHVGRVIGKGGMYIRLIQQITGATVTLPRFSIPGSKNQIFTITGDRQQVPHCKEMLMVKIAECQDARGDKSRGKQPRKAPTMHTVEPRRLTAATSAQDSKTQPRGMTHPPAPPYDTVDDGFPVVSVGFTTEEVPSVHVNGVLYVRIPDRLMGRVIGKHGHTLKELHMLSGTKINLPRGKLSTNYREMQVLGTNAQRQKCHEILMQKIPQIGKNVMDYGRLDYGGSGPAVTAAADSAPVRVQNQWEPGMQPMQPELRGFGNAAWVDPYPLGHAAPYHKQGFVMLQAPAMQYHPQMLPPHPQMYDASMLLNTEAYALPMQYSF